LVDGFFLPASQSIPSQLVTKEDLPSANALNQLSHHLALLLGPLIGAGLVALVGPASAFGFDGLTFVASALCLLIMHFPATRSDGDSEAFNPGGGSSRFGRWCRCFRRRCSS
jgi:predicted MFS family arabinose efflux permease